MGKCQMVLKLIGFNTNQDFSRWVRSPKWQALKLIGFSREINILAYGTKSWFLYGSLICIEALNQEKWVVNGREVVDWIYRYERGGNGSVGLLRIVEVVDWFYYWGSVFWGQWKLNCERKKHPGRSLVFLELLLLLLYIDSKCALKFEMYLFSD